MDEVLTTILSKYTNFVDIFFSDLTIELSEYIGIKYYTIKIIYGKWPLYGPIYSLGPVGLKTLKIYIETNLANSFIKRSKFPADASILFVQKPNDTFCLYINYRGLNNLAMKNWYPLLLIGKSLDRLSRAKCFI